MDVNCYRLPPSVIKKVWLPLQFSSLEEAQTIENIGNAVSKTTTVISCTNTGLDFFMKSSLNKFWGFINSQQIVVDLPKMEGIHFPANVMTINK